MVKARLKLFSVIEFTGPDLIWLYACAHYIKLSDYRLIQEDNISS